MMKKLSVHLLGLAVLATASPAFGATTCKDFQDENVEVKVLKEGKVLTKENWKTIDVILSFNHDDCLGAITQELIEVKGERFWRFKSNDDSCDGGNSYGSIYSEDLKTPIAHIYDGDAYCREDWRDEERHEFHKCDLKAEELAKEKMKAFGLDFDNTHSSLELRKPYTFSFIRVEGTVTNKDNRKATVNVLTRIDGCKFASVTIENLEL